MWTSQTFGQGDWRRSCPPVCQTNQRAFSLWFLSELDYLNGPFLTQLNVKSEHCHSKVYEWVSWCAGSMFLYLDFLQPSTSHFCAYKLPVKHLCLVAPTILSSLGSVQTWEHKYLYQLYTLSWIFISTCWTSVFPLHSFILFLYFDSKLSLATQKKLSFV